MEGQLSPLASNTHSRDGVLGDMLREVQCILCLVRCNHILQLQYHLSTVHSCSANLALVTQMCLTNSLLVETQNKLTGANDQTAQRPGNGWNRYGWQYDDNLSWQGYSSSPSISSSSRRTSTESFTSSSNWWSGSDGWSSTSGAVSGCHSSSSSYSGLSSSESSCNMSGMSTFSSEWHVPPTNSLQWSPSVQTSTPNCTKSSDVTYQTLDRDDTKSPFEEFNFPRPVGQIKNPVPDDLKQKIIDCNPDQCIEFIYSQRQNDQMVINNYILKKKKGPTVKHGKRKMYWVCVRKGCPVRVTSSEAELTNAMRAHNHDEEHADVKRRRNKAIIMGLC